MDLPPNPSYEQPQNTKILGTSFLQLCSRDLRIGNNANHNCLILKDIYNLH